MSIDAAAFAALQARAQVLGWVLRREGEGFAASRWARSLYLGDVAAVRQGLKRIRAGAFTHPEDREGAAHE